MPWTARVTLCYSEMGREKGRFSGWSSPGAARCLEHKRWKPKEQFTQCPNLWCLKETGSTALPDLPGQTPGLGWGKDHKKQL